MNVCVSVLGRFWAFDLANQLEKHGVLTRIITSYPRYAAERFGISRDKVVSIVPIEIAKRTASRLVPYKVFNHQYFFQELYDKVSSRFVEEGLDVFIGWSGLSEHGLRKASRLGAKTVLERGSTHIEFQRDLLETEAAVHGIEVELPHPRVVEKELREYELCNYISVPSEFVRRTFLEKGFPADRIIKNPYGVDLSSFRPLPKEDDLFRVIFVGTAGLRKGTHYLLRAFAELKLPAAELWLVGAKTPEIVPFFRKYEGSFRYFGPVPQRELPWYYSQCSVFSLLSIEEGLALVQAQAMACGLPLLATPNTGCEELIRDGVEGYIVAARSVEAIQEKILLFYADREHCREMGMAARLKIASGLTWDDYGDRLMSNLEGLSSRS